MLTAMETIISRETTMAFSGMLLQVFLIGFVGITASILLIVTFNAARRAWKVSHYRRLQNGRSFADGITAKRATESVRHAPFRRFERDNHLLRRRRLNHTPILRWPRECSQRSERRQSGQILPQCVARHRLDIAH